MSIGQKVCTECNSWQNWRRFFNLSTATLSLLVALVSVISVASPVLFNFFKPKEFSFLVSGFVHLTENTIDGDPANHPTNIQVSIRNIGDFDIVASNEIRCIDELRERESISGYLEYMEHSFWTFNSADGLFLAPHSSTQADYELTRSGRNINREPSLMIWIGREYDCSFWLEYVKSGELVRENVAMSFSEAHRSIRFRRAGDDGFEEVWQNMIDAARWTE